MSGRVHEVSHLHKTRPNYLHIRAFRIYSEQTRSRQIFEHSSVPFSPVQTQKKLSYRPRLQTSREPALHTPYSEKSRSWTKLFFLLSTIFLFFHTQHNIISKIQQNKTTDTYSTSQGPIKREGEREGQQEHKSHSFIQSRMSNKKHCQASMVEGLAPPTRAVVHSHDTICRRLRIQYVFLHMCGVNQF